MKRKLSFDPQHYTYGPATRAIRTILTDWERIDWFEPPVRDADVTATRHFTEHNAASRAWNPKVFAEKVNIRVQRGDWLAFHSLCERVRLWGAKWDWKFSGLKKLTKEHTEARGWRPENAAPARDGESVPRPGELFFKIHDDFVVWTSLAPSLDLKALLKPTYEEVARWYLTFADIDVREAIEWQLAEASDDTTTNPFVPLVRCYADGFYPFSLAADEVVLFGFGTT